MTLLDLSTSDWVAISGIAAGLFASILGSAGFLIFRTGAIVESIRSMNKTLEDVPKIKYSFGQVTVKVDTLWRHHFSKSNSPVVLNETGLKVLETSKIETFTDKYYQQILSKVRDTAPANPYQAQESLIEIINEYKFEEDCKLTLQKAAFNSGHDIDSVLYVAAINIRDKIIGDLGFNINDIDVHDPKKSKMS